MRTVISHFYNEEYLLPWWLSHHVNMFDHGVLIDYGSTDNSLDICRTLAPHWRIVRSRNLMFEALMVDFEVMQYEAELPGWKIALNTTEFLCCPSLPGLEMSIQAANLNGCYFPYAVMVDAFPDQLPVHDLPLVRQKHHGFMGTDMIHNHGRVFHRYAMGAYLPGRHTSHLPGLGMATGLGMILWYSMSPWTEQVINRKLQIQSRIPEFDRRVGFGWHHMTDVASLEQKRVDLLSKTIDLSDLIQV